MVFEAVFGADFVALIDFAPLLRKATRLRVLICTARRRLCESNRIYLRTFQRLGLEGYGPHRKLTVFFSVETGENTDQHFKTDGHASDVIGVKVRAMVAGAVCSVIEMGCFSPELLYTVHHHGEVFATAFFTVATDTLFSYRFAGTYFKKVGQFGGRIHGVGLTDLLDPVSHIKSCAGKLHGSLGFRESVLTEFVGCISPAVSFPQLMEVSPSPCLGMLPQRTKA